MIGVMFKASKFKNCKGKVLVKESYLDLKDGYKQGDSSVACSSTLVANVYGGSGREVVVLRQSDAGKR